MADQDMNDIIAGKGISKEIPRFESDKSNARKHSTNKKGMRKEPGKGNVVKFNAKKTTLRDESHKDNVEKHEPREEGMRFDMFYVNSFSKSTKKK